jgi:hypothetical protein
MSATPQIISSTSGVRTWKSGSRLKSELSIEAVAELDGVRLVVKKKFEVRWKKQTMKG